MPLKPCLECGREISTEALACPSCGAPTSISARHQFQAPASKVSSGISLTRIIQFFAVFVVLFALAIYFGLRGRGRTPVEGSASSMTSSADTNATNTPFAGSPPSIIAAQTKSVSNVPASPATQGTVVVGSASTAEVPTPMPSNLAIAGTVDPEVVTVPPEVAAYDQGRADRLAWESWFNSLTGAEQQGANFWASQRSLRKPELCNVGAAAFSDSPSDQAAFDSGCQEATTRLAASDIERKADPLYRAGWNALVISASAPRSQPNP